MSRGRPYSSIMCVRTKCGETFSLGAPLLSSVSQAIFSEPHSPLEYDPGLAGSCGDLLPAAARSFIETNGSAFRKLTGRDCYVTRIQKHTNSFCAVLYSR